MFGNFLKLLAQDFFFLLTNCYVGLYDYARIHVIKMMSEHIILK